MKKILTFYFLNRVRLFIVLILGMFLVLKADVQEMFWVPSDPPKADYKIDVRIDLANKTVEGKGTITFRNKTSRPINCKQKNRIMKPTRVTRLR